MASTCDTNNLFTVDYERRPFCCVRAGSTTEAIGIAERFLAISLRGQTRHASIGKTPIVKPPATELSKLRARRATSSESGTFAAKSERDGVASPYLAAVLMN